MSYLNTDRTAHTTRLLLCALFTALTAVCSAISIPLPFTPIPVSLATLAPLLAGGLLGAKYGALSQLVYLLLGAVGAPVFHNFTGGLGIALGPTGGYIVGYIAEAFVCGLCCERLFAARASMSKLSLFLLIFLSSLLAIAACYFFGTIWFIISSGSSVYAALLACIVPFIPGDFLKSAAAAWLLIRLSAIVEKHF